MSEKPVENRRLVRVACMIPNGLMIRATIERPDDVTGKPIPVASGPGVRLNGPDTRQMGAGATNRQDVEPGVTEVDAEFMAAWMRANAQNPVVAGRQVWILDENPTAA